MIKKVFHKKNLIALIINEKEFLKNGVNFLTPNSFSLQLGFMGHKKNHIIKPHTHLKFLRKITNTMEILFVKKGILRVDFYSKHKQYLFSHLVKKNNIIVLIEGSHGFKMLKNCFLIEVKQGPFSPNLDKVRFNSIDEKKIKIKK